MQIKNIEDLTTGWESTIYALNLTFQKDGQQKEDEVILRIYSGDNAGEKAMHEFQGMQLLSRAGYPVPRVHLIEGNPTSIGKAFMLMERIKGEVMWHLLDRTSHPQQREFLTQFCELYVRLHRLDWSPFVESPVELEKARHYIFIDRWINDAKNLLAEYGREEFLPVIGWLEQRRDKIATEKPSVVHNDFHPANILVAPHGPAVVIDWTGWRVSDYRFDLGWTLLLAHVYAGEDIRNVILSSYENAAGETVDNLEFFEVCACARRLFDVTTSITLGAERLGMRADAEETMRSQAKHLTLVYDILRDKTQLRILQVERLLRQNFQGRLSDSAL